MSEKLQQVHVRINDAATGKPTPVRVRFTDEAGTYFAPPGRIADLSVAAHADLGGNVELDNELWAYVDGTFEILLPPGRMRIRVAKGPEYREIDEYHTVQPGRLSMRLTIERIADLRAEGWYSGDVASYSLTPHTALLEAAGEDLAVVNLLVTERDQDGKLALNNITAFSGQSPALEIPGHLVAVNSRNDSNLGNLILLHAHRTVYPLSFDARNDSWILEDWCDQCHRKKGLVVAEDYLKRTEKLLNESFIELIRGKIDSMLLSRFNLWRDEDDPEYNWETASTQLDEWYDILNLGLRIPAVGGSAKDSIRQQVGLPRTYAWVGPGGGATYSGWIEAIREGRSWLTSGPLLRVNIGDKVPGDVLHATESPYRLVLDVKLDNPGLIREWKVVYNGVVILSVPASTPSAPLPALPYGGWLAVCCYSDHGKNWAHTNPFWIEGIPSPAQIEQRKMTRQRLDEELRQIREGNLVADPRAKEHLIAALLEAKNKLR